jgi:outer membrane protein assembly factor BamB
MNKSYFKLFKHSQLGILLILIALFLRPTSLFSQELKWKFYTGGSIESSPALGEDGTIYFCVSKDSQYVLYALNPDGTKKWDFITYGEPQRSSPCIGEDGIVYFGSPDSNFYAINPDGTQKWKFETEGEINSSAALSLDGTIYFTSKGLLTSDDSNLYALNPDGTLKWKFAVSNAPSAPSVAPDGAIYFGTYTGIFYALTHEGIKKWEYNAVGSVEYSPAIDSKGIIYFSSGDGYLIALKPSGSIKWRNFLGQFEWMTNIDNYAENPTIAPEGTVYFGMHASFFAGINEPLDYYLLAINPDGTPKWNFETGDHMLSSAAVGSDGTIYFGCYNGKFYALNSDGSLRWEFITGDEIKSSPAISSDGTVYFGSNDGYFYALYSDSQGLADSDWAKYHHDNQNTGSVHSYEYSAPFGELEKPESNKIYYGDEIEVSGWALSLAGILNADIYVNDVFQGNAELGISREDIYQRFPEYDNKNAGFEWIWNIQGFPRGEYVIEAIAFNALGEKASLGKKEIVIFEW